VGTRAPAPASLWVETDSYDRAAFRDLCEESESLRDLIASGANLLPHFEGFVVDLFAALFKLNVVLREPADVRPSAGFFGVLLRQIVQTPMLRGLRETTALDETRAGLAALLLGERLLELIRSERIITRAEMLDYWSVDRQLAEIEAREEEASSAEELSERASEAGRRQLAALQKRMRRENEAASRRVRQTAAEMQRRIEDGAAPHAARVVQQVAEVQRGMGEVQEESAAWARQLGGGGRSDPGRQIELGKHLATNPKLRRLGQMVGRMREQALALRRKMFERADEEAFEVRWGTELSRLLPRELVSLHHPVLRRDFARRFLEGELLQYELRGVDTKGRGPMVVCLDVSSSMAGDKEIWSKAVTLTLLDIARRQRRRFRSISFSSPETPLHVLDLAHSDGLEPDLRHVFDLAEYFPGGGTDFQRPLDASVDCLRKARYRRGDVVFITDGECRVDPAWLEAFRTEKKKLGFSVFSVLIDVGPNSVATVREFSDRVATVSQLTGESARDVFVKL
jgi:uncharacterized protein with von Willebrand factor type A (vWA) domain